MKKILGIFGIVLSIATIVLAGLYIFDVVDLGYSIFSMIACVLVFGMRRFAIRQKGKISLYENKFEK